MVVGEEYVIYLRGIFTYKGAFHSARKVDRIVNGVRQPIAHRLVKFTPKDPHSEKANFIGFEHEIHCYRLGEEPQQKVVTWDEIKNQPCEYHSSYVPR